MVASEHLVSNRNGLESSFGLTDSEVSALLCQAQALTVIFLENALTYISFHLCWFNEQSVFHESSNSNKLQVLQHIKHHVFFTF